MSNFSSEKTYALFASPNNKKLLDEFSTKKIDAIIFPAISTNAISTAETQTLLENLTNFDWLIFSDVYAAEYFIENLAKFGIDPFDLDVLRVCACGESVADRLRFSQLHADVIPPTIKHLDVLDAIKEYVHDESEFENLRFLLIEEKDAEGELAEKLENLKSYVVSLPVYSAEIEDNSQIPKLRALLKGGAIDEFIFSNHFDALNLARLFPNENLSDLLAGVTLTPQNDAALKTLQEFRVIEK